MSTNQSRDADVDRLLRAVLKPAADSHAGECPDAGMLAAFVESNLSAEERSALDAHIVQCSRCQEALVVVGRDEPVPDVAPARSRWFTWVTMPRLRWLVPITALATVAILLLRHEAAHRAWRLHGASRGDATCPGDAGGRSGARSRAGNCGERGAARFEHSSGEGRS